MNGLTVRYRVRFGQAGAATPPKVLQDTADPGESPTRTPPCRAARLLALAYAVERAIEDGRCLNYAAAAKSLGWSHPRMAHITNLLNLSAHLQGAVVMGTFATSEAQLRLGLRETAWADQEAALPNQRDYSSHA